MNMYSQQNPFRNTSTPVFKDWLAHAQRGGTHSDISKRLFKLACDLKARERIWDLCDEICRKYYEDK